MIGVGFGLAAIAVQRGEAMGGYDDREGGVSGTLDPLSVRVLTIDDGHRRFALVVLDVICVNHDLVEGIRAALDVDICWVSATHTHAGPETGCRPGGAPTPAGIRGRLISAAVTAFRQAVAAEAAHDARAARARIPRFAGTRAGSGTDQMAIPADILAFFRADGKICGILLTIPVHPTVLPSSNTRVSTDLVGGIRRAVGERFRTPDARPWVIVTTGAAGDISTRHTRSSRTIEAIDGLGGMVSEVLADAMARLETVWEAHANVRLQESSRTIELARTSSDDIALPEVAGVDSPEAPDDSALSRNEFTRRQGVEIARALRADSLQGGYQLEVSALALGNVLFVAIPAELFLHLGEVIHARLAPTPAFVIGYANGYLGYLPDRSSFTAPTYETYVSPVRKGSGERVADEAIRAGLPLITQSKD